MLAEAERRMDSGELAYVMLDGRRVSVEPERMKDFSLVCGQTIN
jgi:hypothetical protein